MRTRIRLLSLVPVFGLVAVPGGLRPEGDELSRLVVRAPWGTAPGAFVMEDHGARPGPSAIVAMHDRLYVLDRVAARVQVFGLDGALLQTLPVGSRTVDMLAVDGNGVVLVLDAFVGREVRVLRSGKTPQVVPLPKHGRALPSGVFADRGRFWIEWQHGAASAVPCAGLLEPWTRDLTPSEVAHGRPTAKGWVRAARTKIGAVLEIGKDDSPWANPVVVPDSRGVQEIVALDSDAQGRVMIAWVAEDDPERRLSVALLSAEGELMSRLDVPDGSITDLYQRLSLAPDGRLFQLRTGKEGVEIREWAWPELPSEPGGAR
jgi:hypothetical protein